MPGIYIYIYIYIYILLPPFLFLFLLFTPAGDRTSSRLRRSARNARAFGARSRRCAPAAGAPVAGAQRLLQARSACDRRCAPAKYAKITILEEVFSRLPIRWRFFRCSAMNFAPQKKKNSGSLRLTAAVIWSLLSSYEFLPPGPKKCKKLSLPRFFFFFLLWLFTPGGDRTSSLARACGARSRRGAPAAGAPVAGAQRLLQARSACDRRCAPAKYAKITILALKTPQNVEAPNRWRFFRCSAICA
jgi:hypothetical protein